MPFLALRFDADADAVERWADALIDAGALSVDVADQAAGTAGEEEVFDEPGAARTSHWPRNRVTALFAAGLGPDQVRAIAAQALGGALPPHVIEFVPDTDWVRATQAQFHPTRICDKLWILPSWCRPVDEDAINVRIDPGLAFGTGTHPTTRLCLRWLAAHPPRAASLLDYGCGSGVLAIAAAKLGAARVAGVDVDPDAIAASRDNAAANGVAAAFCLPDELTPSSFDVVVANILAGPIELLAPLLAARAAAGGRIILSGILEAQADAVIAAYARWFNIAVWEREEGWVALVGARSANERANVAVT